jgi:transposase InsO family protein
VIVRVRAQRATQRLGEDVVRLGPQVAGRFALALLRLGVGPEHGDQRARQGYGATARDEARGTGAVMADRTAWRICRDNRWWSVFGKKRGKGEKAGPPVHDDLVRRDFSARGPNRLWLADITEHSTGDGKLYLCAVKDVFSNRIVGYSIDARMKSCLAALDNAVARCDHVDGCILHSDRGSQGGFNRSSQRLERVGVLDGAWSAGSGPGGASEVEVSGGIRSISPAADPTPASTATHRDRNRSEVGHRRYGW